jgi:dTDP-4-amino-4,6-dideoxygalactose transaminase
MIPRLNISFPIKRQWCYWFGKQHEPREGEYLLNHARTGIVMALRAALPKGGRVGVVAYNCHTVANAVVNAGCVPFFMDATEKLTIDVASIPEELDAIVVTNLFGIRNDIGAIRKRCPGAIIIVDNAHGYGLPVEGDFTVYSINQGKFPALGEGGILVVGQKLPTMLQKSIAEQYAALPGYGFIAQVKLFAQMMMKAIAYSRCMYWLTMKMKKSSNPKVHQEVVMRKMAKGVSRLYKAALPEIPKMIEMQRQNAAKIDGAFYGENAFMAIVRCEDPAALQKQYAARGIETATHFSRCIDWAEQFGYKRGSCPKAEELTTKLLMIPTYRAI